jgi:hypothetical protein
MSYVFNVLALKTEAQVGRQIKDSQLLILLSHWFFFFFFKKESRGIKDVSINLADQQYIFKKKKTVPVDDIQHLDILTHLYSVTFSLAQYRNKHLTKHEKKVLRTLFRAILE